GRNPSRARGSEGRRRRHRARRQGDRLLGRARERDRRARARRLGLADLHAERQIPYRPTEAGQPSVLGSSDEVSVVLQRRDVVCARARLGSDALRSISTIRAALSREMPLSTRRSTTMALLNAFISLTASWISSAFTATTR